MKHILVVGSGRSIDKRISFPATDEHPGSPSKDFDGCVVTLDYRAETCPDIVADLNKLPYLWGCTESFEEIHAYSILEHCGQQGDAEFFFGQFNEFHRILKPNGFIMITVPMWNSKGALAVPDHKRIMPLGLFGFLEESYYDNVGKQNYGDYRHLLRGYWDFVGGAESSTTLSLALRKV